jgi:hypothetical protein
VTIGAKTRSICVQGGRACHARGSDSIVNARTYPNLQKTQGFLIET